MKLRGSMEIEMDYICAEDFSLQHTCVTIGKFDGVHLGHRLLLEKLSNQKQKTGQKSVVFTFDFHPGLFFGSSEALLYTVQEKRALLESCGVDVLIAYPFTKKTSAMEAEDFIRDLLVGKLGASFIVVGEDNHFGHNRRGDVAMLAHYQKSLGYKLCACKKVQYAGEAISSTRIRQTILQGNMEEAGRMLGSAYHMTGVVKHGKSLGRTLGFPTINLEAPKEKLLPPNGVYMTRTRLQEGMFYGVTNVGVRPSVGTEETLWVETCLLDYQGDCYGETVTVEFLHFVRQEEKFGSLDELRFQISRDKEACRQYFNQIGEK